MENSQFRSPVYLLLEVRSFCREVYSTVIDRIFSVYWFLNSAEIQLIQVFQVSEFKPIKENVLFNCHLGPLGMVGH